MKQKKNKFQKYNGHKSKMEKRTTNKKIEKKIISENGNVKKRRKKELIS